MGFIDRLQTREPVFYGVKRPYNTQEVTITAATTLDLPSGTPVTATGIATGTAGFLGLLIDATHIEAGDNVNLVVADPAYGACVCIKEANLVSWDAANTTQVPYTLPDAIKTALQGAGYKFI
jgi:hypothetical protein